MQGLAELLDHINMSLKRGSRPTLEFVRCFNSGTDVDTHSYGVSTFKPISLNTTPDNLLVVIAGVSIYASVTLGGTLANLTRGYTVLTYRFQTLSIVI